ncbi:MAG: tyrosine-type recombinase/integrase [Lachnospiraceae bacterium]|nr:tyrosine-type recombinase/integrase [Lachnospiraceae bacterium]
MHGLRATFATRMIEAGVEPKTLQEILGHSKIAITMDLYAHVTDDTKIFLTSILTPILTANCPENP